jgi:hypothetical protein
VKDLPRGSRHLQIREWLSLEKSWLNHHWCVIAPSGPPQG